MRKSVLGIAVASVALWGCPDIAASVNVESSSEIEIDLMGECMGSGMSDNASGKVTWTKSPISASCDVTLDWAGQLVDMNEVKTKIDDDAGGVVKDVKIVSMVINLRNLRLVDSNGQPPGNQGRFNTLSAVVKVEGNEFYTLSVEDFVAATTADGFTKSIAEGDPSLTAVNAALTAGSVLNGTAELMFTATPTTAYQTNNPHKFIFDHKFTVEATGSPDIGL